MIKKALLLTLALFSILACGQAGTVQPVTRAAAEYERADIEIALSHNGIASLVNSRVDVYEDISPDGLAGSNRYGWRSVLYQADGAYYATLMAIHTGDPALADKALRCVETGLAHQDDDGTFDRDLKSTLRFVILGSASLSFLSQSEFAPLLEERIDLALRQFVPTSALLLEMTEDPVLLEELRETANVATGVAFVLTYLGDRFELDDFRSAGLALAYDVMDNLQAEEGYYLEKGGWDTSYQMVSIKGLYFLYESASLEESVRADILASLRAACAWEISRIDPTGQIDDTGNTRTANSPEDSPEGKQINYSEVAMTFAFLSSLGEGFEEAETYYELVKAYYLSVPTAPNYEVVSITTLTTDGGRVDWSHDGQWIYYDHWEPDGFWDVYRIHPDGTGNECLTCDHPELPNRNQGQPQIHPNGRYLVFQAEKAEHARPAGHPSTGPGRGHYNDLWVLDLETGDFHQLTDVRSGTPAGGSLHAHFSNDGTKLLWSDLEGPGGRFGDWQLAVADFITSPTPQLTNTVYYNPGPQPIWLEAHGWGPDDSWIYFTCTPVAGMDDNDQDICYLDLETEALSRLTFTSGLNGEAGEWDEHAHLSPLHDVFSFMSSTPYGTESIGDHGEWLRTELWLMNVDGSNQRRMTFFNDTEQVIVADNDWNPSATLRAGPAATRNPQLAVTMFMRDRNEIHVKIIEFAVADQPYWPFFGYDRANTGHSPHPGPGPGAVETAWFYPAVKGRVINQQQTVDADGTVYFATWGWVDEEAEDYAHGLLYALNPDGTLKWVYDPGPADCPLEKTWCYGTIETSPAIGPDGTIYIGRGDGVLRAVNPDNGTLKWSFGTIPNTKGRGQIIGSPAIAQDGTIYFGTIANLLSAGFGNNVFYALNPDGTLKWTYPADAAEGGTLNKGIWSNPAIGPDTLTGTGGTVYFASGYTIYALNPDGTERWHKTTIYKMYTPVVGPDGTIYVQATGATGVVYALNPDGTKKWVFAVDEGETTVSNVSIGPDGTLYVGSGTREDEATPDPYDEPQDIGKLYALVDKGDHAETKWEVDFGSSVGAPAIDGGGIIYVGLRGDTSTLRQSSGQAPLSAGLSADPPVRGRAVAVRDAGDHGEVLWSVEARGELWMGKPVIGSHRTVYFADAVCIDYLTCDQDTDVPAVYAVREAQHDLYLPLVVKGGQS